MLKVILYIVVILAVIGGAIAGFHQYRVARYNQKDLSAFAGEQILYTGKLGKVLVVYYSLTGHTQNIAEQIAHFTGGDLYRIQTQETFKLSPAFYAQVKKQLKTHEYPALAENAPDMSAYDVIFVGAPIWWYTAATPVWQFWQEADFKGKKVVPFSTQGSNYGSYFEDFKKQAQNAQVLEGAAFNNVGAKYRQAETNKLISWLNGLK